MKKTEPRDAVRAPLTDEELLQVPPPRRRPPRLTEEEEQRRSLLREARAKEMAERAVRVRAEQALLVAELRTIDSRINSIGEVCFKLARYKDAVPILLRHLLLPYSAVTSATIADALAAPVPAVRKAWPILVDAYKNARSGYGIAALGDTVASPMPEKDALASVLSRAVTDKTLDELIHLVKDREHGDSRILLLSALRKRRKKSSIIQELIKELASDPELHKEIASWRPL